MKAIILARVSDKKQDSNEAQISRVSQYVAHKELDVWKTYELEESSTSGDRKKFQEIVSEIESSVEPLALVVDTVDRLQRSFKESVQLDDLRKEGKLEIHFYRENLVISKDSNSSDLLRWDMAVMFARSYVLQLSDNVKRKQEQMLKSGIYPTRPPYGYKRVPKEDEKDKTKIVVDEFASRMVKKVYEWYSTKSYSMDLIRKKLKEDYDLDWSKGFLDKVLKNDFYYGVMTWKEKMYPHKYPPLISKALFDSVQEIKAGFHKKPVKYQGKKYFYRGLLKCGHCGLSVTPEKHKGIVYYHCTQYYGKHGAAWLREDYLTEQFANVFKNIQVPENIVNKIVDTLGNVHEGKVSFRKEQSKKINAEREKYSKRVEKLYMDRLDGRITETQYDEYYQSFRDKIAEMDTRLGMLQEAEDNYYITSKYLLELANRAYDLFMSSEVEERRQLINLVLSNVRVVGKEVQYDAVKPFDTILDFSERQSWLPLVDMFLKHDVDLSFVNVIALKNLVSV